ncbi:MAG: hypothetical protein LUG24_07025 [Clostridiales bacterium]|nr:hypothetical protein [Clostridiales bacterium]
MIYYKIVNIISKFNLILGLGFLFLVIYTMAKGDITDNYAVSFALKAFSISEEPSFAASMIQICIGVLGLNIKKGTGAPGGCVVFGLIVVLIKFFDIVIFITSENTPIPQLAAAGAYFIMYIIFIYSCAKQWD